MHQFVFLDCATGRNLRAVPVRIASETEANTGHDYSQVTINNGKMIESSRRAGAN